MEDEEIIRLYYARDEGAVRQTEQKYGPFCRRLAGNILAAREDAEECVNDTWLAAWRAIPPARPRSLRAFLGRIVRNLAISRRRADQAQKRGGGLEELLSELEDCLPAPDTVERAAERAELGRAVSGWLRTLAAEDERLFIRRYWYGDGVKDLAAELGRTPNQISQRLLKLRRALKTVLEEGEFL